MRFAFGDAVLDTARFLLERGGEPQHVQPQVFDVLGHLVLNRSRVVPKTELLDAVWGDRFVSESTLTSRIKAARRAVGDDGVTQHVIKTVHGRGYRWVADVEVVSEPAGAETVQRPVPSPRRLEQRIRFCRTTDGERLAYATVGEGPPLVRAAHWITHLDHEWASPVWQHWMEGLSRQRTLVRYDERGCGLSDHDPDDVSLDSFVHDLETVVDDLGLERFPLMGLSQGGPVAVEYAHRHPERVSRLILVGAFVKGRRARSLPAPTTSGSTARTAGRRSPTSSGSARSVRTSASSPSTPTTRPCSSGATGGPPRSSSCSTPWRPASPRGWPTSRRPGA